MLSPRKRERWLPLPLGLAGLALAIPLCRDLPLWHMAGVAGGVATLGWTFLWRRRNRIPVLNYHAVTSDPSWLSPMGGGMATHPAHLDAQLADLAREGVRTLFVSEVAHALEHPAPCHTRRVALTFDDGFADAWHSVLPLLRKHRAKATLFVNPAMLEPGDTPRNGKDPGYLNRGELKALHASGLVEIQPHGLRHDRLPWSSRTRPPTPGQRDVWGFIREHPERPWAWHREATEAIDAQPEQGPALARPAWLPAERRMESPGEYRQRVCDDLIQAREALSGLLPKGAPVLCWPENQAPPGADVFVHDCGYRASLSNHFHGFNRPGTDPAQRIARVSVPDLPGHPGISLWIFRLTCRVWEGQLWAGPLLGLLLWLAKTRNGSHILKTQPLTISTLGTEHVTGVL